MGLLVGVRVDRRHAAASLAARGHVVSVTLRRVG
ncbi:hypothetical protein EMIT0158MI4_80298 [Burkholderia ambifaria]